MNIRINLFNNNKTTDESEAEVADLVQRIWQLAMQETPNSNKTLLFHAPRRYWSNRHVMDILERECQKAGVTLG